MAETANKKVIVGPVRLAYVHVYEPYTNNPEDPSSKPKYSAAIMVPKTPEGEKMLAKLRAAQAAAKAEGPSGKWKGKGPTEGWDTIKDGDDKVEDNPEYEGYWVFNASSTRPVGLLDQNKQPAKDNLDAFYSGVWAYVSLNAYHYANSGKRGVTFGLQNLMKARDDERFAGGASAETDFADIEVDLDSMFD